MASPVPPEPAPSERLDRVWPARTERDLLPIFDDLPGRYGPAPEAAPWARPAMHGYWSTGPRPWAGRRGVPAPLLVVLVVLLGISVATHVPVFLAGLLVGLVRGRLGDLLGHRLTHHLDDDAVGDLDLDVRRGLLDLGHGAEDPGGQHHPVTRLEVELELTSLLRTLLLRPDQQEVEQDDDDDKRKEFHGGSAPTV